PGARCGERHRGDGIRRRGTDLAGRGRRRRAGERTRRCRRGRRTGRRRARTVSAPENAPDTSGSAVLQVIRKPRRSPGDRGPAPLAALTWASFFGAGYFPVAPGTAGTAAAMPLWWLLSHLPWPLYLLATGVIILTGTPAADRAGRYYGVADSGHIVLDGVAGYLVTMLFLPRAVLPALAGFFFFRL